MSELFLHLVNPSTLVMDAFISICPELIVEDTRTRSTREREIIRCYLMLLIAKITETARIRRDHLHTFKSLFSFILTLCLFELDIVVL